MMSAHALVPQAGTESVSKPQAKLYTSREEARRAIEKGEEAKLFNGVSVGVDIVGPIMRAASSYGNYEGMVRVNLLETYFPVLEIGLGDCSHTEESTNMKYSTRAPYFRMGCDMNFANNKQSGNRIFGGVRYGFSSFEYDITAPDMVDPNWGTIVPYQMKGVNGNKHWGELVFGLESRIFSHFQIGWAVRYKFTLSDKHGESSRAWYVPGFGKNKNGSFGANFNLIFEL